MKRCYLKPALKSMSFLVINTFLLLAAFAEQDSPRHPLRAGQNLVPYPSKSEEALAAPEAVEKDLLLTKLNQSIALGDFNRDQVPDIAVADFQSDAVWVMIGDEAEHLRFPFALWGGKGPRSVVTSDFNRDGARDLAVAYFFSGNLAIFLGRGDGTFQNPVFVELSKGVSSMVQEDFNADGIADLAVGNFLSGDVFRLRGLDDGSFEVKRIGWAPAITLIRTSDFDKNDLLDLVAFEVSGSKAWLFANKGNGAFSQVGNLNPETGVSLTRSDGLTNQADSLADLLRTRAQLTGIEQHSAFHSFDEIKKSLVELSLDPKVNLELRTLLEQAEQKLNTDEVAAVRSLTECLELLTERNVQDERSLMTSDPLERIKDVIDQILISGWHPPVGFNSSSSGEEILCGQTLCREIGSPGEQDCYTFRGNGGERVSIAAFNISGTLCARAELYDSSGRFLGSNSCNNSTGSVILPSTGTYTIVVQDYSLSNRGSYCVNLQFTTGQCGTSISCGQTVTDGNIMTRAQQDSYAFSGNAGEAVSIAAFSTSGALCARAELYGPSGQFLGSNSCNNSTGSVRLPSNGTYTILVRDYNLNDTGQYVVNLQFTSGRCGTSLSCGQTFTDGRITSRAQQESYAFTGDGGEVVNIAAFSTSGTLCTRAELYSPSGQFLGSNSCNNSTGSVRLPSTGIYTILVRDYDLNDTGQYVVNLQFTSGRCGIPISCGQTVTHGNIASRAQQDSYSFSGNVGEAVNVAAFNKTGVLCARAELYSQSGQFLGSNSCNNSTGSVRLPTTGTYTILVRDYDLNDTGEYTVSLQFTTGRCGTPISCGQTITDGSITSKAQQDSYAFTGNAGEAVNIAAFSTSGTLCARAELYSPSGQFLGSNSCNNSTGSVRLPMTGTYTILVRDYDLNDTGEYTVNLQFTTGRCGIPVSCGPTVSGNVISVAQQDSYAFSGTTGEIVNIAAFNT